MSSLTPKQIKLTAYRNYIAQLIFAMNMMLEMKDADIDKYFTKLELIRQHLPELRRFLLLVKNTGGFNGWRTDGLDKGPNTGA